MSGVRYLAFYQQMDMASKIAQRKQRFASIRSSLSAMPVIHQTSLQLQQKLQKNRSRKPSAIFTDKEMTLSKVYSDDDSDSSDKFHSLFKDKYTLGDKIGEGAHGVVRNCFSKATNERYAVKTITLDREHILFLKKNFIDIKALNHEHIIRYKALFFEMNSSTCHLIMDYLPFPDLLHLDFSSEQFLKEIVYQILLTLAYIHDNKICHRDIKPENILYDSDENSVKLIDFGISKKLIDRGRKRDMLTLTGTPYYRAPEMFSGGGYDEMVDLWALGVTMFKLMTGATPFESEYHSETIANIIRGEFSFPAEAENRYSKGCRNLVYRLLKRREERLTAEEAIKDMWFIDLYKREEDEFTRSMSLNQNFMFNNISMAFNTSLANTYIKARKKESGKEELAIKEGRSFKEVLQIEEEESMIYGCEEPFLAKPISVKDLINPKRH